MEKGIIKSKGAERFLNMASCDDNEPDIKDIGKIIKKEFAAHNISLIAEPIITFTPSESESVTIDTNDLILNIVM